MCLVLVTEVTLSNTAVSDCGPWPHVDKLSVLHYKRATIYIDSDYDDDENKEEALSAVQERGNISISGVCS